MRALIPQRICAPSDPVTVGFLLYSHCVALDYGKTAITNGMS